MVCAWKDSLDFSEIINSFVDSSLREKLGTQSVIGIGILSCFCHFCGTGGIDAQRLITWGHNCRSGLKYGSSVPFLIQ